MKIFFILLSEIERMTNVEFREKKTDEEIGVILRRMHAREGRISARV